MLILIARHGEDVGCNTPEEKRLLTKRGRKQAEKLGKLIKHFNPTYIYSSSLNRAKQTAKVVAEMSNLRFRINDFIHEQQLFKEEEELQLLRVKRGYIDFNATIIKGEKYTDLISRAEKVKRWILSEHQIKKDRIVLITHGRFMTVLISLFLGFKPDGFFLANYNTSYAIIRISRNWRPMLVLPSPDNLHLLE